MEFFSTLQDHSEVKLSILRKYTEARIRKICLNPYGENKCLMVDGFAGAGIYNDSKKGSPLILVEVAKEFVNQSRQHPNWKKPEIKIILNEYKKETYEKLKTNLVKIGFFENENIQFSSAEIFSSDDYDNIEIICFKLTFEKLISSVLYVPGFSLIPSFCFVDPFGFSTTPFGLIQKYLENNNAEIFFNFMYEETNRFINHPETNIRSKIASNFGLPSLEELQSKINAKKPIERKKIIVETYEKQILENTQALFIRNFDVKKNNKTKMILFHMTKNLHGLKLMKDIMWKHDDTGTFTYYGKQKEFVQLSFDDILNNKSDKQCHVERLAEIIKSRFEGYSNISIEIMEEFVALSTIYPCSGFLKNALKILEKNGDLYDIKGRKKALSYPPQSHMNFK